MAARGATDATDAEVLHDVHETLDPLELEHVIGFTGHSLHTAVCHPRIDTAYLTGLGAFVVIGDTTDPHRQEFLEAHDNEVSAVAVDGTGRLFASGQLATTRVSVRRLPRRPNGSTAAARSPLMLLADQRLAGRGVGCGDSCSCV